MPSKFGIVLILLLISLSANCIFFFDNRILERIAFSKLEKKCVPLKSFHKLVNVCETLSQVNERYQQLFMDIRLQMEEEGR